MIWFNKKETGFIQHHLPRKKVIADATTYKNDKGAGLPSTTFIKGSAGFTLIELLVVIGIIAILSSIAVINLQAAKNRGSAAKIIQEIKQIDIGLRVLWADHYHWLPECEIQDVYYDIDPEHALFCEGGEYPYESGSCSLIGRGGCNNDPEPDMDWFITVAGFDEFFSDKAAAKLIDYQYDNDNDNHGDYIDANNCLPIREVSPGVYDCEVHPYYGASLYIQNIDYHDVIDRTFDNGDGGCCGRFLYEQGDVDMGRAIYKLGFDKDDF